jgi:hypothetical protein
LGELLPNFDLKKLFLNYEQDFSWKNAPNLVYFEKKSKSYIIYYKFYYVAKYIFFIKKFLLSYLPCNQVWLNHLMDDCNFNYITKLKKKTMFLIIFCRYIFVYIDLTYVLYCCQGLYFNCIIIYEISISIHSNHVNNYFWE